MLRIYKCQDDNSLAELKESAKYSALTLIRLANKYIVPDWRLIRGWNPHIDPKTNMIINGECLPAPVSLLIIFQYILLDRYFFLFYNFRNPEQNNKEGAA